MIGWGTPEQIALYVGRPVRTIRTWARRNAIPSACDPRTKRLMVHAATTRQHAESRESLFRRAS